MATASTEYRFPCKSCGASLRFQPGQNTLICEFCGHRQDIGELADAAAPAAPPAAIGEGRKPALPRAANSAIQWDAGHKAPEIRELPLEEGLRSDLDADISDQVRMQACANCGAQFEMLGDSHATTCPFCATPVVTDTGATRRIKPQAVMPFVLTEQQARESMENWMGKLWFAPSGLLDYARRGRKMTGVYSPFWTFDASTRSEYSGQRGDAYYETVYVTREINGRQQRVAQQIRRVRWRRVSGRVSRDFNDVVVLASRSLPRAFSDALAPWDLSYLRQYNPEYLAGFKSEGYTVQLADGHQIARQEMAGVILNDACRDIGGDEQQVSQIRTAYDAETFKHVLLPIWSAAYKYNGKSFRFLVNGQTGRVQGERPWSVWKILAAVIAALLALTILLYFTESGGYINSGVSTIIDGVESGRDYIIQGY